MTPNIQTENCLVVQMDLLMWFFDTKCKDGELFSGTVGLVDVVL